ncbi:MAG: LptF/LptG family permease [Rhodothermales bacterium]
MTYDLHIIRRLFTGYVLLIAGLIIFFVVLHYVEYVDDYMDRGATMKDVFLVYYPNYVPEIVKLTSPLALFISAIFLTSRLSQRLELASLQTAGVSLYRLMVPFAITGLLVSTVMFGFNGWIVPETNRVRLAFEQDYTKDAPGRAEYANIHRQNAPGSVLSVNFYERRSITATSVTLQQFSEEGSLLQRIDADRMVWNDSLKVWTLMSPIIRTFDENGERTRREMASLDTTLALGPRDLARVQGDVEAMTITEARAYLQTLQRTAANRTGASLVGYHTKFSYPFANLILVLLAVPLASVRRRGGHAVQLGIGLFVAFTYLAIMKLTEPFGYAGTLSPVVTAWLPHILFALLAGWFLWRTRT